MAGVMGRPTSMARHSSVLLAAAAVIVAAGAAFMTISPGKSQASVWANDWFCAGFSCLILGLAMGALGLIAHFRRRRPKAPAPVAEKAGHARPAHDQDQTSPPLAVRIRTDSRFEPLGQCRVAAMHVEAENTTDRDIPIAGFEFSCDSEGQPHWDRQVTNDQRMQVAQEITRRQNDQVYGPSLEDIRLIPARSSVSGWYLVPVSRNPAGGTPECTLIVEDDMGNKYLARLPRREPRTYEATTAPGLSD